MASRDASPHKSPTQQENTGFETHVKFLVSNAEAGVIIGKGGSTINEFQTQSGARIILSRNSEVFPGTNERIVTISGLVDNTLKAVSLILSKLLEEFGGVGDDEVEPPSTLKIIVPSSLCGGLIGKGGANIKSFKEESRANIVVSSQDNICHGPENRLVMIDGTINEQMVAIDLILSKLDEDPHYGHTLNAPLPFSGYSRPNFNSNGPKQNFERNKVDENTSLTIGVSDDHVSHVLGRGGRNVIEITQATGARISISPRDDFIPGTSERKLTITGPKEAIREAEDMILERVAFAERLVIN